MSNPLSVRRVRIQTLNERGEPEGEPSYGVMAADDYATAYNDLFESYESLAAEIARTGCILALADPGGAMFEGADWKLIGQDNYYGNDWRPQTAPVQSPSPPAAPLIPEPLRETFARLWWSPGDFQDLFDVSEEAARQWLTVNEEPIRERLVELGWDVLGTLGDLDGLARRKDDDE